MQRRHYFKQAQSLEERLAGEAKTLREQAKLLKHGAALDDLIRKARQAETGSQVSRYTVTDMKRKAPIIVQAADVLRRARELPVGPARNDLRLLARGLLTLYRAGLRANVQFVETPTRDSSLSQ